MHRRTRGLLLLTALMLFGCGQLPVILAETPPEPTTPATATAGQPSATSAQRQPPPEAIEIQQPGDGSRLTSPLVVQGEADPTFENSLGLRLLSMDGSILAEGAATIQGPIGERGPFEGELAFTVVEEQPALLQVFATSPRDGNVTHLSSVVVTPAAGGETIMQPASGSAPEQIHIVEPAPGQPASGGSITVRGFGLASFEQTLVVRLEDATGAMLVQAPLIVAAPDLGQPGPFALELDYDVAEIAPGRIVVWDPSPAFGAPVHLSSIEIELAP